MLSYTAALGEILFITEEQLLDPIKSHCKSTVPMLHHQSYIIQQITFHSDKFWLIL